VTEAIRVEPLGPERVDDYLSFFDSAFADNPRWAGCYCAYYDDPCADDEWVADAAGAAAHRAFKAERIRRGSARGLLAYRGAEVIGWCNAGPRSGFGNLRAFAGAISDPDEPVGCVMCFIVLPAHRRSGVGSALLAAVDDYFRELGLAVAEGYPRAPSHEVPSYLPWSAASYHGTESMFRAAGYDMTREVGSFAVMRKRLG